MTIPPIIRIFFAVELNLEIKQALANLLHVLKRKAKKNAIRWTMPENLHITLQFLPAVRLEDIELLMRNVRTQLQGKIKVCKLIFNGVELFPNPYRPRVIVLSTRFHENLTALSQLIGQGILASHYEIDTRPFKAHLTLGRIKHPQEANLSFLKDCMPPVLEAIDIKEVVLFRSEPQPEGSKYSVIERIQLENLEALET